MVPKVVDEASRAGDTLYEGLHNVQGLGMCMVQMWEAVPTTAAGEADAQAPPPAGSSMVQIVAMPVGGTIRLGGASTATGKADSNTPPPLLRLTLLPGLHDDAAGRLVAWDKAQRRKWVVDTLISVRKKREQCLALQLPVPTPASATPEPTPLAQPAPATTETTPSAGKSSAPQAPPLLLYTGMKSLAGSLSCGALDKLTSLNLAVTCQTSRLTLAPCRARFFHFGVA